MESGPLKTLLLLVIGAILGAGAFKLYLWINENTSIIDQSKSIVEKPKTDYILDKQVTVWLPWWDQDNGFESLKNNRDKISVVKPVWYEIDKDGSLKKYTDAENREIIDFAKDNNIKIIPVITNNCEPYESQVVLSDEGLRQKNIDEIVKLVEDNNYDGIEPNYECLEGTKYRKPFSDFISQLGSQLHQQKKLLSTSVHAKTSDQGEWEGPAAQDWQVLNDNCDQIKLMTYDYHWSTSEAGDIAPISWMEEVLAYAVKVLDKDKIYLGIPFYGYDWIGEEGKDLVYRDVSELRERFNPEIKQSAEKENYFNYQDNEEFHTVYFFDHNTIKDRIELVNKYEIAGIGVWRIGQEDSKNWQTIENLFNKGE